MYRKMKLYFEERKFQIKKNNKFQNLFISETEFWGLAKVPLCALLEMVSITCSGLYFKIILLISDC